MRAEPGYRLIIPPRPFGKARASGTILETRGDGGSPPFLVRWDDDPSTTSLVFPGNRAQLDPSAAPGGPRDDRGREEV